MLPGCCLLLAASSLLQLLLRLIELLCSCLCVHNELQLLHFGAFLLSRHGMILLQSLIWLLLLLLLLVFLLLFLLLLLWQLSRLAAAFRKRGGVG